MDQRIERRIAQRMSVSASATLRVLGDSAGQEGDARILEISGRGVLLTASFAVPCGSPVRIESGDMLLLGEVCRVQPQGTECRIAVQVRHSLIGLAELDRLNRALLAGAAEAPEPALKRD